MGSGSTLPPSGSASFMTGYNDINKCLFSFEWTQAQSQDESNKVIIKQVLTASFSVYFTFSFEEQRRRAVDAEKQSVFIFYSETTSRLDVSSV